MSETELVRRLEKLERDNRRLKGFALATLVLASAMGFIFAVQPVPDVIKAHVFSIVDSSGTVRGLIGVVAGAPSLAMYDAQGNARVAISLDKSGSPLFGLIDAQGNTNVLMDLNDEGSPFLRLADGQGSNLVTITSGVRASTLTLGTSKQGILLTNHEGLPYIEVSDSLGYSAEIGSFPFTYRGTSAPATPGAATFALFSGTYPVWLRSATLPPLP